MVIAGGMPAVPGTAARLALQYFAVYGRILTSGRGKISSN